MANFPTSPATGTIFSTGQNVYKYNGTAWEIVSSDISLGYPEITGSFIDLSGSLEKLANVGASTISNITASVLHLDGTFSSGSNIAIPVTGSAVKLRTETGHREDAVLHLKFDGPDGSTSGVGFVDRSPSNHTVTAYSGAKIDASTSVLGTSSAFFDTSSTYLEVPYSDDFNFGLGDFTVHCWYYPLSSQSDCYIITVNAPTTDNGTYAQALLEGGNYYGAGKMRVAAGVFNSGHTNSGWTNYSSTDLDLNTWHHIAVTRNGSTVTCWVNGIANSTTGTAAGELGNHNRPVLIGRRYGSPIPAHAHCNLERKYRYPL